VLEQDGADQAVEIAAGDKAVALGNGGHGQPLSLQVERIKGWRSQGNLHHTLQFCIFQSGITAFLRDLQSTPRFLQTVAFHWHCRRTGIKVATSQQ
jgi:hypothetical protein